MKIIYLDKVNSTEDYIKDYLDYDEDVAVIAKEQTAGRGTKGRDFSSSLGGAYLSFFKHQRFLSAKEAFKVVQETSLAVVNTLLAFNVFAQIKWPNDIYVNGKKICGILTKNTFLGDRISYSILGIGLNVNNDLPSDLKQIATSMKEVLGREVDLNSVISTLIFNLTQKQEVGLYARYSCVLGKKIKVLEKDKEYFDYALEILPSGLLKLKSGKVLSSEEVKIVL